MGPEVLSSLFQSQFFPEILSVKGDGSGGEIQQICDVFRCFTLPYKVCHLDFRGAELCIAAGESTREWRDDLVQIYFKNIHIGFLPSIEPAFSEFLQVGLY